MIVLHLASVDNDLANGVCVVVPQHICAQAKYAKIALMNIRNEPMDGVENQIQFRKDFELSDIQEPFNKPDLVIFHECYRLEYISIAKNLVRRGIPYIIVPHGELKKEAQRKKWIKKFVANILLFNRFIFKAVAIQCLSKKECESTMFGRQKMIGTNGIYLPKKEKKEFSESGVKFIYVGRLEAYSKGLDILIKAVKNVARFMRENGCRLDIYGPDYCGRFENVRGMIEKNGVADIVFLHREVYHEEKESRLLEADIFIQTSRSEGMPLGILEAMSYGIPCLVTEGTSIGREISGENAGWCSKTNPTDVGRTIIQSVKERKEWKNYGNNGKKFVSENFEWEIVARKALSEYESIINFNKTKGNF